MSLSPTEAAILAAFGASAITGAVTFSITVYSARRQRDRDEQQRQHERERDADERANRLADERRDRLRGGYQAIVYAASTMHAVAKELQAIWANEPVEVRNERLNLQVRGLSRANGCPTSALVYLGVLLSCYASVMQAP